MKLDQSPTPFGSVHQWRFWGRSDLGYLFKEYWLLLPLENLNSVLSSLICNSRPGNQSSVLFRIPCVLGRHVVVHRQNTHSHMFKDSSKSSPNMGAKIMCQVAWPQIVLFHMELECMCWGCLFVVVWFVCYTGFPRTGYEEQSALKVAEICLLLKLDLFWFGLFLRVVSQPRPASNSLCSRGWLNDDGSSCLHFPNEVKCFCPVVYYCWVLVLDIKSRALCILGKHCTPSPLRIFVLFDNIFM